MWSVIYSCGSCSKSLKKQLPRPAAAACLSFSVTERKVDAKVAAQCELTRMMVKHFGSDLQQAMQVAAAIPAKIAVMLVMLCLGPAAVAVAIGSRSACCLQRTA